jgi:heme oxygenase (biliverdin-IX-beta and delta-forming)
LREQTKTRRFLLRDSTSAAHAALDAMVGPLHSMADYRRYLAGIAGFRLAIEPSLRDSGFAERAGGWRPTSIAAALRADLADLGMSDMVAPDMTMRIGTTEAFFGCAYVIEGSALGARLLYGRARELGLGAGHGARHLAEQSATLDNWRAFTERLEALQPFDIEAAGAAAVAAFGLAEDSFRALADE